MKPEKHEQDVRTLQALVSRGQRNQFALILLMVLMAIALMTKRITTVLEPPVREKTITIVGDKVGSEWLEEMGGFMASMLLSGTPGSIEWQQALVLNWTAPQFHGELQKRLTVSAKRLKESNATQVFFQQQVAPDPDHNRVVVMGQMQTYVNGTLVPGDHTQAYQFEYTSLGGRAMLSAWEEVPLDDPWLVKQQEVAQRAAEKLKKATQK
jgi:conjugal transfer pilus assembly protein TraE